MENASRPRPCFISTDSHSGPSHHLPDYANDNFPNGFHAIFLMPLQVSDSTVWIGFVGA